MAMKRQAPATAFKPGQSGNPKGRPPGIKETHPRGYLRVAIDIVMAAHPQKLVAAIRRGLDDPRHAHSFAELIGKVGKEIGADAAHDTKPVIFHFYTNLNPMALAPSAPPASLPQAATAPAVPLAGAGRAPAVPNARPSRTSKRAGAKPTGGSP